jgi:hypothetical protein
MNPIESGSNPDSVTDPDPQPCFQEVSGWLDEAERRLERSEVVESGLAAQLASLRPKMEGLSTMAVCIVERFAAQQADVEPEMEHLEQRWETVSHKIKHSAGGNTVGESRPAAASAGKLAPPPTVADPLTTTSSEEIMTLPEEDSSRDSSLEFHSANSPSHNNKQISSLEKEGSAVEVTKSAVTSPATVKSPPPTLPKPRWYMESLQQQQTQPGPPSSMSQEAPPPVQQVIITSATLPSPHILPPQQFRIRKQQTPPAAKRSRSPERTVLQQADSPLTDAPRSVLDDIDRQNARDNEIIDRLLRGTSADIEDVKQARRSYNSVMMPRDGGAAGHARDVKDFEEKHTNISVKLALTQSRLHELEKETDAVLRSDLIDMEMRQLEAEVGLLVLN